MANDSLTLEQLNREFYKLRGECERLSKENDTLKAELFGRDGRDGLRAIVVALTDTVYGNVSRQQPGLIAEIRDLRTINERLVKALESFETTIRVIRIIGGFLGLTTAGGWAWLLVLLSGRG